MTTSETLKVLIVEDSANDAELIAGELRSVGFNLEWKRVETEAEFRAGLEGLPDVIFSDYTMRQFNGLRAVDLLRERGLDIPFILVSGTVGEEKAVEAMKHGATDYLLKDRVGRLWNAVVRVLEQKQLRDERRRMEQQLALQAAAKTKALEAAELRYRRLFETARDGILILDVDTGRINDVNPLLVELLGFSHGELVGKTVGELRPFKNIVTNPDSLERLQRDGYVHYEDLQLETKDGRHIAVEFASNTYQAGEKKEIQCHIRDITERKRAEAVLHETPLEEVARRRFSAAKDLILIFLLTILVFGMTTLFNLSNAFLHWMGQRSETLFDESFVALTFLMFGFLWFGFRRWQESQSHVARQKRVQQALRELRAELETRVQHRTADLSQANKGLHPEITERKRAEEALRATQQLIEGIMNSMPVSVFWKDRNLVYLGCNAAFARDAGFADPKDIIGKDDYQMVWRAQADLYRADDRQVVESGCSKLLIEEPQTTPEGNIITLLSSKTPLRGADGEIIGLLGTYMDITEHKMGQEKIRRANRALQMLTRCNEALIRATSENQLLADICRIAVEMGGYRMAWVGYAQEDAFRSIAAVAQAGDDAGYLSEIKLTWDENHPTGKGPAGQVLRSGQLIFSADTEQDSKFYWQEAAIERGYRGVICLPLRDGKRTFGLLGLYAAEVLQANAEEFKLLQELADDLAFGIGHLRAEQERQRSEESQARLATAVEQAAETIVITDPNGTILYANPALEKSSGYTRAEALGQNTRFLKSGKQDAEFYRRMWEVLRRGEIWSGHFVNRRKDGELYEEEATISPVRDAKGAVVNYVAVKRDVTRELQLESQLRQSQKMEAIGLLAGGIAHDFNNILAAMMLQAELSGMVENVPAEVQEGIQLIRAYAERAAKLTRQLLLFSRRQVMQPRELDLNEVVTSLTKMLQRIIGEDVRLQLHLHPTPLITRADAGMLDQVLMNLAVNARDAMPGGGRLLIETATKTVDADMARIYPEATPGRYVWLSVSDTGSGIPTEVLPRIFEPFFTTKAPGQGTGLGLATVFGIVRQHHGWLKVYSDPGQGANFQVFLPASDVSHEMLAATATQPKAPGGTETILLVEDDTSVRMLTCAVLERVGYRVLEAAHGVEAIRIWEQESGRIDLLFTDIVMPEGLSGRELVRHLQTRQPKLKVILTSGYSADIAGRELSLQEGQNFIQKPASPAQLLDTVRRCLDG